MGVRMRRLLYFLRLRLRAFFRVSRQPPSVAKLRIPVEALRLMPQGMSAAFVGAFWQVGRQRGRVDAEILERWRGFAANNYN